MVNIVIIYFSCSYIYFFVIIGITLGGRSRGALTDKVITALTNYYGATIKRHGSNTEAMRQDILATLSHCSSTDDEYDHTLCPKGIYHQ